MTGKKYMIESYPFSGLFPQVDSEPFGAAISVNEKGGVRCLLRCSDKNAEWIKRALEAADAKGEEEAMPTPNEVRELLHAMKNGVAEEIRETLESMSEQLTRPSVLHRPTLTEFQGQWRAQFGSFVSDYKPTAEAAMLDFDRKWCGNKTV